MLTCLPVCLTTCHSVIMVVCLHIYIFVCFSPRYLTVYAKVFLVICSWISMIFWHVGEFMPLSPNIQESSDGLALSFSCTELLKGKSIMRNIDPCSSDSLHLMSNYLGTVSSWSGTFNSWPKIIDIFLTIITTTVGFFQCPRQTATPSPHAPRQRSHQCNMRLLHAAGQDKRHHNKQLTHRTLRTQAFTETSVSWVENHILIYGSANCAHLSGQDIGRRVNTGTRGEVITDVIVAFIKSFSGHITGLIQYVVVH